MLKRYPYLLYVLQTAEATLNTSGDFVAGSSEWVYVGKCRDEAKARGAIVQLDDGTTSTYESLIFLPKSVDQVKQGDQVEVRAGTSVRITGAVQRSVNNQLGNRLWV